MKSEELRDLTTAELKEKLGAFRKELFDLRFQHTSAQLENTQRLPVVRRTIARIMTIMREKESGA